MKRSYSHLLLASSFSMISLFTACSKNNEESIPTTTNPPVEEVQKKWTISTLAGTGDTGYIDGPARSAKFTQPATIALDSSGNLFVSDFSRTLRKISNGVVSTYTGKNTNPDPTFLYLISDIVIRNNGDISVIQSNLINTIHAADSSTVLAGTHEMNYTDGIGTNARFSVLRTMTADLAGNLYLPDYDRNANFLIRKISPAGVVSTITLIDNTGYSSGSRIDYYYTSPIAIDKSGNIFFCANGNSMIKKADVNGHVTVYAGAPNIGLVDGKGTAAQFNAISALSFDNEGNLYVADLANHAIRKITSDGTVSTLVGNNGLGFVDGSSEVAKLYYPSDLVIDKNGIIYFTDAGNGLVRKLEYK